MNKFRPSLIEYFFLSLFDSITVLLFFDVSGLCELREILERGVIEVSWSQSFNLPAGYGNIPVMFFHELLSSSESLFVS